MNAPPPYYAPGPKKSNVGLIVAIVVGAIALCCILPAVYLGFVGRGAFSNVMGYVGCGWSIEEMRDGLVAYSKAHGGKLPPKEHWQDDIASYVKAPATNNTGPFKIPPTTSDVCDAQANSSVTYNVDVAGKKLASVEDPGDLIILWEAPGRGRNQSAKYTPPSYETGPKFMGNLRRGWIEQPLYGDAYFKDQNGRKTPIGTGPSGSTTIQATTDSGSSAGRSTGSSSGD